jgi:hypothetical protein
MKTVKLSFFSILLLSATLAGAQNYAFKVLANKGTNEVKSGTDAWQPIRTGATLKSDDELKLSDNSYIGLVHANGKPVELKQPGSYKVADLAAKVGGSSTVLGKYTDFIMSNNSAEAKKNRLSATGAVHRGEATAITIKLPESPTVYNSAKTVITWEANKVEGPYIVVINDMFGEQLAKFETKEASIQIDLDDAKFAGQNAVVLEVYSKSDPTKKSAEKMIKKLTPAERAALKTSIDEVAKDITEETAINKIILAQLYEEKKLPIDAIAAYEAAIKLAPEVQEYKDMYEDYLIRAGIKR